MKYDYCLTGLPLFHGNLGISGNFQIIENLRETQRSLRLKKSQEFIFLDLERDLVNPVSIFVHKNYFIIFN